MSDHSQASSAEATSLAGRVALVTGGSRGIGRGIVLALARQGAAVAFSYREREAPARELEADDPGGAAAGPWRCACDVADEEQVQAMVGRGRRGRSGRSTSWSTTPASRATAS